MLGNTSRIPELVEEHGIEMLTIAIPSLKREELQRITGYHYSVRTASECNAGFGRGCIWKYYYFSPKAN
ncbi:hypothetical protein [uncultured Enterococcus sp.]|uniref:nucleoside-diphosphate sugar epimerase/dehydratase n=1 Tax=uncultured Enterococcus sp. TaxID=167972 RepID=UPI002AA6E6CA|nr:hypothetical protein [uncultured Enterococcus sp.]